MQISNSLRTPFAILAVLAAIYAGISLAPAGERFNAAAAAETQSQACANDESGLKLPAGFCATVFADGIGHARHLVGPVLRQRHAARRRFPGSPAGQEWHGKGGCD